MSTIGEKLDPQYKTSSACSIYRERCAHICLLGICRAHVISKGKEMKEEKR